MASTGSNYQQNGADRFSPAEWNRLCRVLCRQRQAGGLLLSRGVRDEAGRLSRPGNRNARPRFVRAAAGQDSFCADHAACSRTARSPTTSRCTAMACTRSRCGWTMPNPPVGETTRRGARGVREPRRSAKMSTAKCGSRPSPLMATRFTAFVERKNYRGAFLARLSRGGRRRSPSRGRWACSTSTTWWAMSAGAQMNRWVDFYRDVMGFQLYQHFDDKDISTEYSALMSKVMSNGNGRVKFPINEPADGQEEVADRRVSGVLSRAGRAAYRHGDRTTSSRPCRSCATRASNFCACPSTYYRGTGGARRQDRRAGRASWQNSASWWIATTKATCCRSSPSRWKTGRRCSTKIIQRKGSRSFGKGNFKALFEAIEREQALRGNL